MNTQISENAPIRAVQHMIDEAKSLGLRVVHRPDNLHTNNVIDIRYAAEQRRIMLAYTSPEAA